MLIVVLFGFLNIKSVKIYAIPYIFATTLLLYKLDTLLLKQKNLPVLDITGFFFRMSTQVKAEVLLRLHLSTHAEKENIGLHLSTHVEKENIGLHLSTHAEKETCYIQYWPLLLFQ